MRLNNKPFELIKSGLKTIELRLNDEKRQLINKGDIIIFTNRVTSEQLKTRVIGLLKFANFEELYQYFNKVDLGYGFDEDANPSDMELYYSKEEQDKYGVVAIEIGLE